MVTIDPKLIIGGAFVAPIIYIWQELSFSIFFLGGLAVWEWVTFDNQYMLKSDEKHRQFPDIGPQQPFTPTEKDWVFDPISGEPVAKFQPSPTRYPIRGPR